MEGTGGISLGQRRKPEMCFVLFFLLAWKRREGRDEEGTCRNHTRMLSKDQPAVAVLAYPLFAERLGEEFLRAGDQAR